MQKKFLIVGAGISGLTLAKVLQVLNFDFEIFESSIAIHSASTGFYLTSNTIKAFEILNLSKKIKPLAKKIKNLEVQNSIGKTILKTNDERLVNKFNSEIFAINSKDISRFLLSNIEPSKIKTNKKVIFVEQNFNKVFVHFADGSSTEGDYLIAADSINSTIRQQLLKQSIPRYSGYICWQSIVEDKSYDYDKIIETWGKDGRFVFFPLIDNQVNWYAYINTPLNSPVYKYTLDDIKNQFSDYPSQIRNIIQKTNPKNIQTNPIMDIKPINNYVFNRILLVGDAAHAATPNLLYGIGISVEDAFILYEELKKDDPDVLSAFERYNLRRLERTHGIINTSLVVGKIAQLENKFLVPTRNLVLKYSSNFIIEKLLNSLSKNSLNIINQKN